MVVIITITIIIHHLPRSSFSTQATWSSLGFHCRSPSNMPELPILSSQFRKMYKAIYVCRAVLRRNHVPENHKKALRDIHTALKKLRSAAGKDLKKLDEFKAAQKRKRKAAAKQRERRSLRQRRLGVDSSSRSGMGHCRESTPAERVAGCCRQSSPAEDMAECCSTSTPAGGKLPCIMRAVVYP